MLSSKDPAATQEFKISALPPEAAEDSDLISALTKLVNEVYASAEDGLWTEGWVTVQANSVRSPAAPSHRGIGIGRELVLFDEQKAWSSGCSIMQPPDLPKGHQGRRPGRDLRTPARLPKQTSLVQSCVKG